MEYCELTHEELLEVALTLKYQRDLLTTYAFPENAEELIRNDNQTVEYAVRDLKTE